MTDEKPATVEEAETEDNVHIVLCGPDGEIKQEETIHNLIVNTGIYGIMDQVLASPTVGKPTHMAIGTGGTAPAAGQTALTTELDRNALTSKTRNNAVVTVVADWAAGDGTGAITEAGIFNASSSGDMYARALFSVINKAAGDTLSITWTLTLSAT